MKNSTNILLGTWVIAIAIFLKLIGVEDDAVSVDSLLISFIISSSAFHICRELENKQRDVA